MEYDLHTGREFDVIDCRDDMAEDASLVTSPQQYMFANEPDAAAMAHDAAEWFANINSSNHMAVA